MTIYTEKLLTGRRHKTSAFGILLLVSCLLIVVVAQHALKLEILTSHVGLFSALVCSGTYLWYNVVGSEVKPKIEVDQISFLFLSFLLISGISTVFISNITSIANHYLHEAISSGVLYVVAVSVFRKDEAATDFLFVTIFFISLGFIAQYWYIIFYSDSMYEFIGYLRTKHFLSIYLIVSAMLCLEIKKINFKYAATFLIILTAITVIHTGSRISILSLFAAGVTYVMLRRPVRFKISFILPILILFFIILTYMLYQIRPESVAGRFLLWKIGLSGTESKSILFGKGLGFIENHLADLQGNLMANEVQSKRLLAGEVKTVLNEYIRVWVETGLAGISLAGLIVYTTLKSFYRKRLYGAFSACIAVLVCCFASYPFLSPPIQILLVFTLSYASLRCKNIVFTLDGFNHKNKKLLGGLIGSVLIAFLLFRHTDYVQSLLKWKNISDLTHHTDEHSFRKEYQGLYKTLHGEPRFLHDYAGRLQSLDDYQAADTLLTRLISIQPTYKRYLMLGYNYEAMNKFDLAEACYKKAENIMPKAFIPKYMLFDLYRITDNHVNATAMAKHILSHPVKIKNEDVSQIKNEAIHYLTIIKN